MTDPIQEVKSSLENQLKEGFGGLQKKYDAVADELQKGNTVTVEMKSQIENQKGEIERIIEQVQKLEEKGIKLRNQNPEKKSFIDFVKGNDNYQALTKKTQSSAEIEITKSDMASMAEVKVTSAGLVAPQYDPVIQGAPRQNLLIRDLIPTTPVTGQAFTYYRELLHTLGAGMVPEGGAKVRGSTTAWASPSRSA